MSALFVSNVPVFGRIVLDLLTGWISSSRASESVAISRPGMLFKCSVLWWVGIQRVVLI